MAQLALEGKVSLVERYQLGLDGLDGYPFASIPYMFLRTFLHVEVHAVYQPYVILHEYALFCTSSHLHIDEIPQDLKATEELHRLNILHFVSLFLPPINIHLCLVNLLCH